ncbi:MAG: hypothetical protein J6C84_06085 [Lachnospiraceae bacterium]|nr:hypothetical protein [Lachnospiraceae bacterium]
MNLKKGMETDMEKEQTVQEEKGTQEEQIAAAMLTLEKYVHALAAQAGEPEGYAADLWERICKSGGVLQELAYYHDYGNFLCKYQVAGCTLADILVWQVDHFKAYLDRPEEMNRYRQQRLLLTAFDIMLKMEEDPAPYLAKMREETGTDFVDKY